jgi:TPP-dependent pyruvate/acetoin dehydrogenase alpha subunit
LINYTLEEQVQFIRALEERIAEEYPRGEMRCPIHLSVGQEAAAVGLCSQLSIKDLMVSTHRSHAHYLAKGGDPYRLVAELYGKHEGCSGGQGGSMHLVDWSVGFAGSTSIVGGTIPVGVGLAFSQKLKGEKNVTVVCIGDAAIEEGVFHEAANFASLHRLPVIFFLEDNDRSCYTPRKERQPARPWTNVANAHGLGFFLDQSGDAEMIGKLTASIIKDIHKDGPYLFVVEAKSLVEHCGPVLDPYDKKEIPISMENRINEIFTRAIGTPYPPREELGKYVYA